MTSLASAVGLAVAPFTIPASLAFRRQARGQEHRPCPGRLGQWTGMGGRYNIQTWNGFSVSVVANPYGTGDDAATERCWHDRTLQGARPRQVDLGSGREGAYLCEHWESSRARHPRSGDLLAGSYRPFPPFRQKKDPCDERRCEDSPQGAAGNPER